MGNGTVLPRRSTRFGVGKEIGGAVYLHRDYAHLLGEPVQRALASLPAGFDYAVVKYSLKSGVVSFVRSPDFDPAPEPAVGDVWTVSPEGRARLWQQGADPWIYHHKWLFVAEGYSGFNVERSRERSRRWLALAGVDRPRIGRRSYWDAWVVPRLFDSG